MPETAATPLAILADYEARARRHARPLPQQERAEEEWLGVGFDVAGQGYVAPLDEVAEILTPPAMSRVPGTRSWVMGVANVRGNLLPVMDLQAFLTGEPQRRGKRSRVLVVQHGGLVAGLLVAAVHGLRHFVAENEASEVPVEATPVLPYVRGAFRDAGGLWPVFSLRRLAESPLFLRVAV